MAKMGRPTKYSDELAQEICDKLSVTYKGLKQLCRENDSWPERETIHAWARDKEDFYHRYVKAKEQQMDWLAEEAIDIAFDNTHDTYQDQNGNDKCDTEWVNRSRLKVDTIKWYTSKLKPKKYGDNKKDDTELTPQNFINELKKLAKDDKKWT
jgi:hypothetical protein